MLDPFNVPSVGLFTTSNHTWLSVTIGQVSFFTGPEAWEWRPIYSFHLCVSHTQHPHCGYLKSRNSELIVKSPFKSPFTQSKRGSCFLQHHPLEGVKGGSYLRFPLLHKAWKPLVLWLSDDPELEALREGTWFSQTQTDSNTFLDID